METPSIRAAFHCSSSTPRSAANRIAIVVPLPCQIIASPIAYSTMSDRTVQSSVNPVHPMSRKAFCRPRLGLKSHCQTSPVTTKLIAYG